MSSSNLDCSFPFSNDFGIVGHLQKLGSHAHHSHQAHDEVPTRLGSNGVFQKSVMPLWEAIAVCGPTAVCETRVVLSGFQYDKT